MTAHSFNNRCINPVFTIFLFNPFETNHGNVWTIFFFLIQFSSCSFQSHLSRRISLLLLVEAEDEWWMKKKIIEKSCVNFNFEWKSTTIYFHRYYAHNLCSKGTMKCVIPLNFRNSRSAVVRLNFWLSFLPLSSCGICSRKIANQTRKDEEKIERNESNRVLMILEERRGRAEHFEHSVRSPIKKNSPWTRCRHETAGQKWMKKPRME